MHTLQTALVAIHTRQGTILYANDFKFDNYPIVGKKPNYKRLKQLGKENVIALIVDALYASDERKTPSEKVARDIRCSSFLMVSNQKRFKGLF